MGKKKDTAIDKKEAATELAEINRQLEEINNMTKFVDAPMQLWCGKWICDITGVYKLLPSKSDPDQLVRVEASHQQIMPTGIIENIESGEHKYMISFSIKRGGNYIWKSIIIRPSICSTKSQIVNLANLGISVTDQTAKALIEYISDIFRFNEKIPVYKSVSHLGWINKSFFPYTTDIVVDGDNELSEIVQIMSEHGSLDCWIKECTEFRKNLSVRLTMDASFASVLINRLKCLSFVFYPWGGSNLGKSVSTMVSCSVWGDPDKFWISGSSTMNAIVKKAALLGDLPCFIDEMQLYKGDPETLVYALAEGKEKSKLNRDSSYKKAGTWRSISIINGERPLTSDNSGAGAINRVIDIEVDRPLFEDYPKTLDCIRENYGHAGRMFIEYTKEIPDKQLIDQHRNIISQINAISDSTGKQVQSLALLLLADKLLHECIFRNEEPIEVSDVVCLLKRGKDVSDSERAYLFVIELIAKNQNRFITTEENRGEIWGKIDSKFAFINKTVLSDQLSTSKYSFDAVKKEWAAKGYLIKDRDGKYTHKTSIGNADTIARYVKLKLMDEDSVFTPISEKQFKLPFE